MSGFILRRSLTGSLASLVSSTHNHSVRAAGVSSHCLYSSSSSPSSSAARLTSPEGRRLPVVTLYTGTDCQLCDVAKIVLKDVAKRVLFELREYNIRDDSLDDVARWRRAYQYDIPVVHLEGKEIARHHLSADEVEAQIREVARADRLDT